MENENGKEAKPPEGRCWIENGILRVELPLLMPNGEFIAYGMLHKAAQIVESYFKVIEREIAQQKGPRILPVTGDPIIH